MADRSRPIRQWPDQFKVWVSGPGSGRDIKKELSGHHIDHRHWVGNVQDERPMPTDDVVPIVADDLRAAVDNDAVPLRANDDETQAPGSLSLRA